MQFRLQGRIGARGFSRILDVVDELEATCVLEGAALILPLCAKEPWQVELLQDEQVIAMEYSDSEPTQES